VNDEKTGWCQQHDNETLQPVKARSYELPSIVSQETTSIVELLIRIKNPDDKMIDAIKSAVGWLERSRIYNIHLQRIEVDQSDIDKKYKRYDVITVEDENAPPVWARYYEIETNRPFFCNRDGIKVYKLEEVKQERRIGYAWYGYWPRQLLKVEYPAWLKNISEQESLNNRLDTSNKQR